MIEEDGKPVLKITGEIYGGLTTLKEYGDYHLSFEVKFGEKTWAPRLNQPRNTGLLYHCTGEFYLLGSQAIHLVNGHVVLSLDKARLKDGTSVSKGKIQIESEGAEVYFRNVRLRLMVAKGEHSARVRQRQSHPCAARRRLVLGRQTRETGGTRKVNRPALDQNPHFPALWSYPTASLSASLPTPRHSL